MFPAAWSNDPVSCMAAPAGMGRIEFFEVAAAGGITNDEPSGSVAAVMPLGGSGFHLGTGAAWDNDCRTGIAQLSGSYVVAGDPIGFMEGLFGPSIAVGASVRYQYADSTDEKSLDLDAGFQFSLFPSLALGMTCTDITEDRRFTTGFSHVFNRNLKAHTSFSDDNWQVGCELMVTRALRVYSGTDGDNVNAGAGLSRGEWNFGYGAVLHRNGIEHRFGISRRFP
ncbi:MAG: hypothetical protein K8S62_06960 [Candidatus Sabulitectum sp.]|nr:hypothetical protein [Candidatus Sabulitectum sp.]